MGDYQHFRGYTLFLYKEHTVELFDLDPAVKAKHLEEMKQQLLRELDRLL